MSNPINFPNIHPHLARPQKMVFSSSLKSVVRVGGRRHSNPAAPKLSLKNYLTATTPTPPATCSYAAGGGAALANIFENDTLGDCVIAAGYHITAVETGNAGKLFTATNAQIIADYSAIGGYVPGNPSTDNGCDPVTALNYWTSHGFADGTKLVAWLAVDATNWVEVQTAMYVFENLFIGMDLPDAWITPFPSGNGFTWDVADSPDPNNGHMIMATGYTAAGLSIDTWGMLGTLTKAAVAQYCSEAGGGELYVMLDPDQIGKLSAAPNGINWAALVADFNAMGGHVPVPVPVPPVPVPPVPPVPVPPVPVAAVTLAEAQQWAVSGLMGRVFLTAPQASELVLKALAKNWPGAKPAVSAPVAPPRVAPSMPPTRPAPPRMPRLPPGFKK